MSNFIEVTFSQNETTLANEAITKLVELMEARRGEGWTYSESDLEIIILDVLAGMAIPAAQVASVVPNAIFRQFGTQLIKLTYNEGTYATGKTTWTVASSETVREIPAGTQIEAYGQGFSVTTGVEVPAKTTTITNVSVTALETGEDYNKVIGKAEQVNPIDWVLEVQFIGETSGGMPEESDEAYLERLADQLALQAPRPITAEDYATFVLDVPESIADVKVGRATSIDGYKEGTVEHEGKVTSGSNEMSEVASYSEITIGSEIVGTDIPTGTYVTALPGSEKVTMSNKATGSPSKQKYKFVGTYENQKYVTTFVTNEAGGALEPEQRKKIEYWLTGGEYNGVKYAGYRELNFKCPIESASYNKISVLTEVKVLPEYTKATVKLNVEEAIRQYLNPAKWGNPSSSTTGANSWLNYVNGEKLFGTVRYNDLLVVIGSVQGVAYVVPGSAGLAIGLEVKGPTGVVDLQMKGPAPLPKTYTEKEVVTEEGKTKSEYEEFFKVTVK